MEPDLKPDRITRWLLDHRMEANLRRLAFPAALLFVTPFIVLLGGLLADPQHMPLVGRITLGTVAAAVAASLPFQVALGGLITAEELHGERTLVLRLANLPDEALIRSFVYGALYRARTPIVLAMAASPALVVGWAHLITQGYAAGWCSRLALDCIDSGYAVSALQVVGLLLLSATMPLALAGIYLTLAVQGVSKAIRLRSGLFAAVIGLLAGLLTLAPALLIIVVVLRASLQMVLTSPDPLSIAAALLVNVVAAFVPLAIGRTALLGLRLRGLPAPLEEQ